MTRLVHGEQDSSEKGIVVATVPSDLFFYNRGFDETDIYSDEVTPVPIPNTAVKLVRVDGIGTQFGAERVDRCRSHQGLYSLNKGVPIGSPFFNE